MGSFENVGVLMKASSGKSLKLELENTIFNYYVSIKDIEAVINGRKKSATVWYPKPKLRPQSCASHSE